MSNDSVLTTEIDNDEGLKSKRKALIFTSLALLALSFSGASISEANTFIFKIKFNNQSGLGSLLVLSIAFLMVRYYNYAVTYHAKLQEQWSQRLLKNPKILGYCEHSGEYYGYLAPHMPLSSDDRERLSDQNKHFHYNWSYQCHPPFQRTVLFEWYGAHDTNEKPVNIYKDLGARQYFKTLYFETREQISSLFMFRENLDIMTPYILGCLAIASFYFNTELTELLNFITPAKTKEM